MTDADAQLRWLRWVRLAYTLLAGLFTLGIVLQVFFAGLGALVSPGYWGLHSAFGNILGPFTIILLVVGLMARLPRALLVQSAFVIVLFALQYVFLYATSALGLPALRALHAVNALALFGVALRLTHASRRLSS